MATYEITSTSTSKSLINSISQSSVDARFGERLSALSKSEPATKRLADTLAAGVGSVQQAVHDTTLSIGAGVLLAGVACQLMLQRPIFGFAPNPTAGEDIQRPRD